MAPTDGLRARDDATLASLAAGGERDALEVLLDRHVDRVHAICRRVLGHPEDALDATQEALIAIVRGIGRFDGRAAFSTWAYRVATNACLDELRRRQRRPTPGLPDDDGPSMRPTARPSAGIEGLADRLAIDEALTQLPEEFRTAVILRDLCDLDYAEISVALAIPAGTVRSRIARGRAQLARLLDAGNRPAAGQRPTADTPDTGPTA